MNNIKILPSDSGVLVQINDEIYIYESWDMGGVVSIILDHFGIESNIIDIFTE